ncbi:MAG: hypothetical protein GY938_30930 [Ketobacter sp.]|nr:hypothetical protein [Ketobacter sp.]
MADNIAVTEGAGTDVATDDVGSVHFQKIKLDLGTDGASAPALAGAGAVATGVQRVTLASDDPAVVDLAAIEVLLGTIDADTGAIKTAVELLDNAVDGSYLDCNMNIAGTDVVGGAGVLAAGVQRVTIATDDEVNNLLGTIDADTSTLAGAVTGSEMQVDIVADGAGLATDTKLDDIIADTAAIEAAVELIDDAIYIDDADWTDGVSKHMLVGGLYQSSPQTITDGDVGPLQITATGALLVSGGGGGTEYTEDVATANPIVGTATMMERDDVIAGLTPAEADWAAMRCSAEGALWVQDFNSDAALALLGTMDTNTGVIAGDTTSIDGKMIAGEGVITAATQRVTLATDDDGVAHLATIAGDTTAIQTAVEIIDDWDAVHDSAASSDGPQLMAAYDATKPSAVADGDAVRVLADEYGRLLAGVEKTAWQADFDSADARGEGETVKASAASTIVVVQSYIISSDVEGWVMLQEEDSSQLTGKFWLKAGGGVAITLPDKAPLILGVDSDLEVICEAAGNVSVSATGYTIPG